MKQVEHVIVLPEEDGQRLDRWLKKRIPYVLVQKFIRTGQVRVDGKRVKGDTILQKGQDVRIPPFEDQSNKKPEKKPLTAEDKKFIRSLVVYDDGDVVIINKPHGLASQGGGTVTRHVDGMLEGLKGKEGMKPRLVHRLDQETSGLLIMARSPKAVKVLGERFKNKHVKKIYWAITVGCPHDYAGAINAPIGKAKGQFKDKMTIDEEEGKASHTEFSVVEKAGEEVAFMAFWPQTGRTHQIRIHTAAILGCPILGDGRYGGDTDAFESMELPKRLHLHARRLTLLHPVTYELIDVVAPLPGELEKSWKALGFDPQYSEDPFSAICEVDKPWLCSKRTKRK